MPTPTRTRRRHVGGGARRRQVNKAAALAATVFLVNFCGTLSLLSGGLLVATRIAGSGPSESPRGQFAPLHSVLSGVNQSDSDSDNGLRCGDGDSTDSESRSESGIRLGLAPPPFSSGPHSESDGRAAFGRCSLAPIAELTSHSTEGSSQHRVFQRLLSWCKPFGARREMLLGVVPSACLPSVSLACDIVPSEAATFINVRFAFGIWYHGRTINSETGDPSERQ